jgi:hypothetical protein
MMGEVFQESILSVKYRMKEKKQNVVLLTDNCSACKNLSQHVEIVVLLPPVLLQKYSTGV